MKHIFAFLFLVCATCLVAQQPGTDAVFEKIIKEYTLHEDGTIDYHHYKRVKLLTHFSFNRLYGETFIIYHPGFQELKINLSQTTHEDGKVTPAPLNAFNEVLPRFATHAPHYNHLREMVVTHPGTEVNAVIELDYNLVTQSGYYPGLMANEVLTETSPVAEKEIIIRIPAGMELHYKVFNVRTAPEITEENGQSVYTFRFNDIKEASHESHQPADGIHLPRVVFSTVTWEEAFASVFDNTDFGYKLNEQMQQEVENLRKENPYDLPFILKVNELVANEVNTWGVPWNYAGYTGRPPIQTWESNGGTVFEKSLFFAALLRHSKVNAEPVLMVSSALYDKNIGCLELATDILVQVNPRELEQMYLSAEKSVDQNKIFELNGHTLITLNPGNVRVENVTEDFENKVVTNGTFVFDDSLRYSGRVEVMMTEAANPYYSIKKDSAVVKSLLTGFSGKEIESFKVLNAAQYRSLAEVMVSTKKAPEPLAQYYFIELPEHKRGTNAWHISYLYSDRTDPFEVPFVVNEQYSYEYSLPGNAELINPVELTEIKTGFGELVLSTTVKNNKVTVKRMFIIHQPMIPPADYPQFKEMFDLWNEKNFRRLVIRRE